MADDTLNRVVSILESDNKFKSFKLNDEHGKLEQRRYLINLNESERWLFDEHIELHRLNGLMLIDFITSTLAFVLFENEQVLDDAKQKEQNGLSKQDWLDQQLNIISGFQLVLGQVNPDEQVPFSIEVLVFSQQLDSHKAKLNFMGKTTQFLHYTSINLIDIEWFDKLENQAVQQKLLMQHMPWLLTAYEAWYKKCFEDAKSDESNKSPIRIGSLTTNNFRIPKERKINLDSDENIHIFHGHNGSGKTTLVESLELIINGKISRLADESSLSDYLRFVKHYNCQSDDCVSVKSTKAVHGNTEEDKAIIFSASDNTDDEKSNRLPHLFLLNQPLIDRLSSANEKQRYSILVHDFFNEDIKERERLTQLKQRKALIESELNQFLTIEPSAYTQLMKCANITFIPTIVEQKVFHLSQNDFELLGCFSDSIHKLIQQAIKAKKPSELSNVLKSLDSQFDVLSFVQLQSELQVAIDTLGRLEAEQFIYATSEKNYAQLFDEYCEVRAKEDVISKSVMLTQLFLDKSLDEQYKRNLGIDHVKVDKKNIEALTARLDKHTSDKVKLAGLLANFDQAKKVIEDTGKVVESIYLTDNEVAVLNKVGQWMSVDVKANFKQLGDQLNPYNDMVAMESRTSDLIYDANNDGVHWAAPLINHLEKLQSILEQLSLAKERWHMTSERLGISFGFSCVFSAVADYQKVSKEIEALEDKNKQSFIRLLEQDSHLLHDALWELLLLFTSAKWLYTKPRLDSQIDSESIKLTLGNDDKENSDGSDVKFIWNTAELNLVAVAFFILCNVRNAEHREYATWVMDDPIQNMDELTAKYFARGLANLQYFWQEKGFEHQLIMLFHGEQVFQDFASIIPAALYHLPWREKQHTNTSKDGEGKGQQKPVLTEISSHNKLNKTGLQDIRKSLFEMLGVKSK